VFRNKVDRKWRQSSAGIQGAHVLPIHETSFHVDMSLLKLHSHL
jgi:hypothetical protein